MARAAAALHHKAAVVKRRSITATVVAARIIEEKMKPCSSANAPWIHVSDCAKRSMRSGENSGPWGEP